MSKRLALVGVIAFLVFSGCIQFKGTEDVFCESKGMEYESVIFQGIIERKCVTKIDNKLFACEIEKSFDGNSIVLELGECE